MSYTENLPKLQTLIWQDDINEAIRIIPEASGNLVNISIQQRDNWISLSIDGAKELIKELQWCIRNQDEIIKESKSITNG